MVKLIEQIDEGGMWGGGAFKAKREQVIVKKQLKVHDKFTSKLLVRLVSMNLLNQQLYHSRSYSIVCV